MPLPDPDALIAADRRIPGGLVACLERTGFSPASLDAVEKSVPTVLGAARMPLLEMALAEGGIQGVVATSLFTYGLEVPRAQAEAELGADTVAICLETGVVSGGDRLRSAWRIIPFRGLLVASDRPEAGADAVMGPGPTTDGVANAALPAPGMRVLDVGCGAGSLALAALRAGARSATAIDINPRAIAVARANAVLNRLELDCRCGDLFAPVAGERFDLVLAQPPYVVRPGGTASVTYLHGGDRGDELAMRLLAELPAVLADPGLALVHFDGPADGDDLVTRIVRAAKAPVDLAVLVQPGLPVGVQAMSYSSLIDGGFGPGYAVAVRAYLSHCRAHGLKAFNRHLVAMRRPARGWAVQVPCAGTLQPERAQLDGLLAGLDLAAGTDAALLASRIRPQPSAQLVLTRPFGRPVVERIEMRTMPAPWPPLHTIDEATAALCDLLVGADSVGATADAYAEACGVPVPEAVAVVLDFVRGGLRRGILAVV